MNWAAAALVGVSSLLIGEAFYRWLRLKPEYARKLTHVLGALSVCLMPYFLTLPQIAVLAVSFVVLLSVIRGAKLLGALYDVERWSYGEILFPLGVCLAALIADTVPVFVVSMVILGVADTVANLTGAAFGKKSFTVLVGAGQKTYMGSSAFFLCTCLILSVYYALYAHPDIYATGTIIGGSLIMTLTESQLAKGIDNALIPIVGSMCMQVPVL